MASLPLAVSFLTLLFVAAPSFAPYPAILGGGTVMAQKVDSDVQCPRKIGTFRNKQTRLGVGDDSLQCFYNIPRGLKNPARVRVVVHWTPDVPGERSRCVSRSGEPVDNTLGGPEDFNRTIYSLDRNARASYYYDPGKGVKRAQAEKAALGMLQAAEPLAHPCLPHEDAREEAEAAAEATHAATEPLPPACPMIIGDRLVRRDWYEGDPPPAVTIREAESPAFSIRDLRCTYRPAYQDEGDATQMDVTWIEGDATDAAYWACKTQRRDDVSKIKITSGTFAADLDISKAILEAGGERIGEELMAAVGRRAGLCPGATRPGSTDGDPTGLPTGGESGAVAEDSYDEAADAYIATHDGYRQGLEVAFGLSDAADAADENGAPTDEVLQLTVDSLVAGATATEAFADQLATAPFPEEVESLVAAFIVALREDARLLREQAHVLPMDSEEAEAELEALAGASDSASAASLVAMRALNEAMGVELEDEFDELETAPTTVESE